MRSTYVDEVSATILLKHRTTGDFALGRITHPIFGNFLFGEPITETMLGFSMERSRGPYLVVWVPYADKTDRRDRYFGLNCVIALRDRATERHRNHNAGSGPISGAPREVLAPLDETSRLRS